MEGKSLIAAFLAFLLSCQIGYHLGLEKFKNLLRVFPVATACHALECYSCEYGTCMVQLKENCGILEVCATETAKVAGFMNFKKKGCMNPLNCLTDSSVSFAGATMTSSPSCCYSSLCNAAAVPKVSVMSGMAAMLALWVSRWF